MHLRHDIAEDGEVDLGIVHLCLNETRYRFGLLHHVRPLRFFQIEQVSNIGFRDEDKPGYRGVSMQQEMTALQPSQAMTVGEQLFVDLEISHDCPIGLRRLLQSSTRYA